MDAAESHVITGHRVQVWSALSRAQRNGRLVEVSEWFPLPGPGDRIQVLAQLRPPAAPDRDGHGSGSRWERARPWVVGMAKALVVLAVLAAVAGAVWLVVLGVLALVAWVKAHLALITVCAVGLVLLWVAFTGGGGCGGMHCGGCRG